jgi:hypothetical protein
MDARCNKYWEDGQELLKATTTMSSSSSSFSFSSGPIFKKILKECHTMSRFLQKNQSSRWSENAQQKFIETIGFYLNWCQNSEKEIKAQLIEAIFQVVKDGLAMPFNVFGTKQKKRLMKWYNELSGGITTNGVLEEVQVQEETKTFSVLNIDEDGFLSVFDEKKGEIIENVFKVETNSKEFKQIQKAIDCSKEIQIVVIERIQTDGNKEHQIQEIIEID